MNKKRIVIIVLSILLVIAIGVLVFMLVGQKIGKNSSVEISDDDFIQVSLLKKIYTDFLSTKDIKESLVLDESALKNLVTGEKFKEGNLAMLTSLQRETSDSNYTGYLFSSYGKNSGVLKLTLERRVNNTSDVYAKYVQEYVIKEENGELTFEKKGEEVSLIN